MHPIARIFALLLTTATLLGFASPSAAAQSRLTDGDVEHLMQNLRDDARSFQDPFTDALGKSAIRKTSRERDARELSKRLARQTDAMLQTFRHKRKADGAFQVVTSTVGQIDPVVAGLPQDSKATERWDRVHADLHALSPAFT